MTWGHAVSKEIAKMRQNQKKQTKEKGNRKGESRRATYWHAAKRRSINRGKQLKEIPRGVLATLRGNPNEKTLQLKLKSYATRIQRQTPAQGGDRTLLALSAREVS